MIGQAGTPPQRMSFGARMGWSVIVALFVPGPLVAAVSAGGLSLFPVAFLITPGVAITGLLAAWRGDVRASAFCLGVTAGTFAGAFAILTWWSSRKVT